MLGEGKGDVELNPEDPVGFRGVDGRDRGAVSVNSNKVVLQAGGEEGAVGEGEWVAFAP